MKEKEIEKFIEKIKSGKRGKIDLSRDEDLSIAIMNLVSIEEHFFFTAQKVDKDEYFDLLREVREVRKELLKMIVKDPEGEVWCISKHLLAASMRLMEVGTKYLGENKKAEAKKMFEKSYDLYTLFWAINLNKLKLGDIKKLSPEQMNTLDTDKSGIRAKFGSLVKKLIDCCIE